MKKLVKYFHERKIGAYLFLLLTLVCIPLFINATTIVILVSPSSIVMGIDSKAGIYDLDGKYSHYELISKIFKSNDCYFALTGQFSHDSIDYNTPQIIHSVLSLANNNMEERIDSISSVMKEKLIESMEVQKTASNGKLILDKKTGEPLSQLVLIGRENEELFAYMISFIVTGKEKNDLQINKKRCPGSDCASVFYGGNIGEIKKFLESGNYNEFNSLDLTGKIKYFIQITSWYYQSRLFKCNFFSTK